MTKKVVLNETDWKTSDKSIKICEDLENGNILFFPQIPFDFPQEEIDFLLKQKQSGAQSRKNIAYKPAQDLISNHDFSNKEEAERLKEILSHYSRNVSRFLSIILEPYAKKWKLDYASFRPFQEKGRNLRTRARNDLLHVDAFPTRPLHGSRILRFFTNINPTESRYWITSEGFQELAKRYENEVSIPKSAGYDLVSKLKRKMKKMIGSSGMKYPLRSPYDSYMLQMHHFLKENQDFQKNGKKDHWDFPPNSCWMVFTDQVSHAALSGQYALEQTLIIPQTALLFPEKSPVCILERMSGKNLVDLEFLKDSLS